MIEQQRMSGTAWVTILSLAAIWGGSFLCYAIALRELPVFSIVALRVGLGAVILWLVIAFTRFKAPKGVKIWGALFVMGILNNVIPFSLIAWAQIHIESGLASILNATTAFFGVGLAALFFADERLTASKFVGVLFGFFGVCIIMGPETVQAFDLKSFAQIALLGSSLSYGFAKVWAKFQLGVLHPVSASVGMLTCSSVLMVPVALLLDGIPRMSVTAETAMAILFLAGPATAIAYLLYYRSVKLAGSGNSSMVTVLVVPFAVLAGFAVLNERLDASSYYGFGFITVGMIILDGRLLRAMLKTD